MAYSINNIKILFVGLVLVVATVVAVIKKRWLYFWIGFFIFFPLGSYIMGYEHSLIVETTLFYALIVFAVYFVKYIKRKKYQQTEYYQITHNEYGTLAKGSKGEFNVYQELNKISNQDVRYLFNLYIPIENNKTSEIDVLMLHNSGIYVFESKNYHGWIFGKADQTYWMQTFPNGEKNRFYNPVMQNQKHCSALKNFLGIDTNIYSYIVFSDKCEFRDIPKNTDTYKIVKQSELSQLLPVNMQNYSNVLLTEEVENIYQKLYPLTQVSTEEKQKHISDIRRY